jgi:Skp family chaperone for outer membrane proteins
MKADFDTIRKDVDNRALSESSRADSFKQAQEKYVALREFEKELRDLQIERQSELTDLRMRMRRRIIDKIKTIVADYSEKNGVDIVLTSTAAEPIQVLHFADRVDITEAIIKLVGESSTDKSVE